MGKLGYQPALLAWKDQLRMEDTGILKPWPVVAAAVGLSAFFAGCGGNAPSVNGEVVGHGLISDTGMLAVLDETIPESHVEVYEQLHGDIYEITDDSSVIFVGRVVDYRERLIVSRSDVDEPREKQFIIDGIVLEADEVLLGEMPDEGSRITIGVWALTELPDGTGLSRHTGREILLFEDGIRGLDTGDSPQYLVYANASTGKRGAQLGLYRINTQGGVVRIIEDESFIQGLSSPFVEVWAPGEAGEHEWVLPYDLQDARDAAVLAKGGIEDTTGPPEEETPGLDEGPVEESGDGSDGVDPGGGATPATDGGETDKEDVGSGGDDTSDSGEVGETPGGEGDGDGSGSGESSGSESSGGDVGGRDAGDRGGQGNGRG